MISTSSELERSTKAFKRGESHTHSDNHGLDIVFGASLPLQSRINRELHFESVGVKVVENSAGVTTSSEVGFGAPEHAFVIQYKSWKRVALRIVVNLRGP